MAKAPQVTTENADNPAPENKATTPEVNGNSLDNQGDNSEIKAPEVTADDEGPKLGRSRINRGNARRLVRAVEKLGVAIEDFRKELDPHFFSVDDEGNRIGPWRIIEALGKVKGTIEAEAQEILKDDEQR